MLESKSVQALPHDGSKTDVTKPAHSSEHSLKPNNKDAESRRKISKPESIAASKLSKKNASSPSPTRQKDGKQRKDSSGPAQQGKENGEENGDGKATTTPRSGELRINNTEPS